jgi:tRNA nucleotidyltransferase (CCA-adding enzyme)
MEPPSERGAAAIEQQIPLPVLGLLETLWSAGHGAYVVGGSLRDLLLERPAADWDLASDARPDRLLELFPGSVYENQFGTVAVRRDDTVYEVTTFRSDHDYADFRRPHHVEFGDSIELDLARRDFTVNALAWGAAAGEAAGLVDPYDGTTDLGLHRLRAVGEPVRRFEEDALRMVRAVRFAATLGFSIEPATRDAISTCAELVRHLSAERVSSELLKLLGAPTPSVGLRLLHETGLLEPLVPELAIQVGVPQNKIPGEDLWGHTLRSVDAADPNRPIVRLAALVHDLGKPATASDGHFYGHETVGATLARELLERLRMPRAATERVVHLVRLHMFAYDGTWSDTAVRRFLGKAGREALDELFALREADNVGSGLPADAGGLSELRARVDAQLAADVALDRSDLAIDGDDLIADLGLDPGPVIGRLLDALLERVIADPALNDAPTLLVLARQLLDAER